MKSDSTLMKALKKMGVVAEAATTETLAASPEALETLRIEYDAFRVATEADTAELRTALEAAIATVGEVEASRNELATKLAAIETANAVAAEAAVVAAANSRKTKLEAAVGTERAPALFMATESMSDASFEAVLTALTTTAAVEAKSALFTEQGVEADVDAAKIAEAAPSKEMLILKSMFAEAGTA